MSEFKSNKPKPSWMQMRYVDDPQNSLVGAQGFDEDHNQTARHPAENRYRMSKRFEGDVKGHQGSDLLRIKRKGETK